MKGKKDLYFTPMQVGYIANRVEPVSVASDAKWNNVFSNEYESEVIPLESHGSILGIIRKEDINKLSTIKESPLNRLRKRSAASYIMPILEVIEASSYINKVVERGLKTTRWDNPGWYVVEYKHKYLGIVNLRQMMEYTDSIQTRDIHRAGEIQRKLLIHPEIKDARFSFLSYNRMANIVGGDWHKPLCINKNLYLVGCFDVAGKNISGSLVTMSLCACFTTLELVSYRGGPYDRRKKDNPDQITSLLNMIIRRVSPADVFVAAVLLYIDFQTMSVEIHNCGLSPVLIFVPTGENTIAYKTYKANLPPLGVEKTIDIDTPYRVQISDGLRIVVYSDGLSDMCDVYGERYGEERTIQFLQDLHFISKNKFSSFIDREIDLWTKDAALADDITLFELRFGKPQEQN